MKLPIKLAALAVVLFAFLFIKIPVFAQTTDINPVGTTTSVNLAPDTNSNVPQNLHTFSQSLMLEIMSSLICNLSGRDPLNPNGECLSYDPSTGKIGYVKSNGGALGAMSSMITVLYTPPLHTSDFVAYVQKNFGLAKPSYAQATGIGFEGLRPIMNAWVVFRNLVYLLFVFVFIVIGLAIMLRVRIDPRTVMTIQNQIPKIIISLILVTFSFAIAGFLIDLMWISIYVVLNLMHTIDPNIIATGANSVGNGIYHPAPQFANDVLSGNGAFSFLGGIHNIAVNASEGIAQIVKDFIQPDQISPKSTANTGSSGFLGTGLDLNPFDWPGLAIGAIGDAIGTAISTLLSWAVGILAYLILIIALLWALLRLWFSLLKAYISILIDVILAPFWIVGGLLPGQQAAGFGGWLRDMTGNLAAFPAVIFMLLMARFFADTFASASDKSTAFIPPLIGGNANNYISNLIALGIVLATPGVVDMIKKAFKAPKIDLSGIAQPIGAGVGFISGSARTAGGTMLQSREARVEKINPTTKAPEYGQVGTGRAFLGRIFR